MPGDGEWGPVVGDVARGSGVGLQCGSVRGVHLARPRSSVTLSNTHPRPAVEVALDVINVHNRSTLSRRDF